MTKEHLEKLIQKIETDIESLDLSKLSIKDKIMLKQELEKELYRQNPLYGMMPDIAKNNRTL